MFDVKRVDFRGILTDEFSEKIKQCANEANKNLKSFNGFDEIPNCIKYVEDALSFIKSHEDAPVALSKNLVNFSHRINAKLIRFLMLLYPNSFITPSGNFIYPVNGYMGWHTNSDFPSKRVYITYVEKPLLSGFKYIKNGNVIDDIDDETIIIREFDIKKDELCWHSVYSHTNRYSFGFRVD